jgi:D-alanine-D-alanine ligase
MSKLNVVVLMGGTSGEREISLSTGKQILKALDKDKYNVYALDTQTKQAFLPETELKELGANAMTSGGELIKIGDNSQLSLADSAQRPDVALIALHGKGGEDGSIQGFLETAGIKYTGSGVLASALAMDKARSKRFLTACGVEMPNGLALKKGDPLPEKFPMPAVVKPSLQGSSDGLTVVTQRDALPKAIAYAFTFDDEILVEEYVAGVEITCAVLGNNELEALPLIEIVPAKGIYDREAKYTAGATDEICPARLSKELTLKAQEIALKCHGALGCRGVSRTDMIVSPTGRIYVLEVNTIPGMTPTSLLPRAAKTAGYSFPELLDKMIGFALENSR